MLTLGWIHSEENWQADSDGNSPYDRDGDHGTSASGAVLSIRERVRDGHVPQPNMA